MAVFVDNAFIDYKKKKWCHLSAQDINELHSFASKIGLKKTWFQEPPKTKYCHYDVTESKRVLAVKNGAIEITTRELVKKLKEWKQ